MKPETELSIYDLMKDWFNFCYDNPELINPNHSAMYFFILQHCNALGWKRKFGLPRQMAMDAIGIRNYKTFSNTFKDLISWGFILLLQKSENQYSANVIGLVKNTKPTSKALSKASTRYGKKYQTTASDTALTTTLSTAPGTASNIVCIDIPITNTTNIQEREEEKIPLPLFLLDIPEVEEFLKSEEQWKEVICMQNKLVPEQVDKLIEDFVEVLKGRGETSKTPNDAKGHFYNWYNLEKQKKSYGKKFETISNETEIANSIAGNVARIAAKDIAGTN
jgi:hypothetical protein